MSGITSILDTLLHQVLGKRVDTASPRSQAESVRPTVPAQAVQALRSEPDPQSRTSLMEQTQAAGRSRDRANALPVKADAAASTSARTTRTSFSAAARTIADLLVRYPAPPSAIRPSAPLLSMSKGGEAEPLAMQLRASVERSGLFYESHLGRWFRGGESGEQLSGEPQMRLTRLIPQVASRHTGDAPQGTVPANTAQGASAPVAAPVAPSPSKGAEEAASSVSAKGLAENPAGGAEEGGSSVRMPVDRAASDVLQGLLRHQLEMLAVPVLRWEGEVWPGVTMAFVLLPLEQVLQRASDEGANGDGDRGSEEDGWQSQLTLRLPDLGEIDVRLVLCGERLELALRSASEKTAERLRRASEPLRERFVALGFEDIVLTVDVLREGK